MKPGLPILLFILAAAQLLTDAAKAEVTLRVSVKVILGPSNEWPDNPGGALNLNSENAIRENIQFTTDILARHFVGYRVVLRNDQIETLSGFDPYWFNLDARSADSRDQVESAATLNAFTKTVWKWHDDSINIYLNDSSSGVCSFPGDNRHAILVGARCYEELIVHELGHYLNLAHTHTVDNDSILDDWADGDGLAETLDDDADATAADINNRYDGNPQPLQPQEVRDNLIFNIMSYHQPQDRWVWGQREIAIETFNGSRALVTLGQGRFVQSDGNDLNDGLAVARRQRTIGRAFQLSNTGHDSIVIRSGFYNAAAEGLPLIMNKPVTLSAWRGPVIITR